MYQVMSETVHGSQREILAFISPNMSALFFFHTVCYAEPYVP